MMRKIIFLMSFALISNAIVLNLGPCPEVKVEQNLNVTAYLGTWYQISRYPNFFEKGNCSSAEYSYLDSGRIKVRNAEIVNGKESSIEGAATFENPNSTEAKLLVKFNNLDTVGSYWVLRTDYTNFSIVWSCSSYAFFNIQFAWILTREKPITSEVRQIVLKIFEDNSLNFNDLEVHEIPECKKLP